MTAKLAPETLGIILYHGVGGGDTFLFSILIKFYFVSEKVEYIGIHITTIIFKSTLLRISF